MLLDFSADHVLVRCDAHYAPVIAIVTFWYIYLTIRMAQWRAVVRREMANADREETAVRQVVLSTFFDQHTDRVRND